MDILHERDTSLTVIKAGTAVVSNAERTALDMQSIGHIGEDIAALNACEVTGTIRQADHALKTVLIVSGAVTAGIERLGWDRAEVDSDMSLKRVASMVGNSALFAAFEQTTGFIAATDLPTHNDLDTRESWAHLELAIRTALGRGLLPILNEGDARSSEELETVLKVSGREFKRFGDNDWLAAHVAALLGARTLIFLTDKDGVLEDKDKPESIVRHLYLDEIDGFIAAHVNDLEASNGGMTSKLLAAKFALEHGARRVAIGNGKKQYMVRLAGDYYHGTAITQRGTGQ